MTANNNQCQTYSACKSSAEDGQSKSLPDSDDIQYIEKWLGMLSVLLALIPSSQSQLTPFRARVLHRVTSFPHPATKVLGSFLNPNVGQQFTPIPHSVTLPDGYEPTYSASRGSSPATRLIGGKAFLFYLASFPHESCMATSRTCQKTVRSSFRCEERFVYARCLLSVY